MKDERLLAEFKDLSSKLIKTEHDLAIAWAKLILSDYFYAIKEDDAKEITSLVDKACTSAFDLDFAIITKLK